MLFKSKIRETPLTQAVLLEDMGTLQQLGKYPDQVLAENELGYNALELAEYLGKKECLKHLSKASFEGIKVIPSDGQLKILDEETFESFFGVEYLSRYRFDDYPFFQKVLKSCSWVLKSDFFAEDVLELGRKYQKGIVGGAFTDVTIQWINDLLGYGIFANHDMEPNEYVGEYTGDIYQVHRFKEQINEYSMNYPKMVWALNQYVIDAQGQGNESRFFNHSYQPNLILKMAVDRDLIHPLFYTNQPISKGTQLTFDYGKNFWKNRGEPIEIDQGRKD